MRHREVFKSAVVVSLDEDDVRYELEARGLSGEQIEQIVRPMTKLELDQLAGEVYERAFTDIYSSDLWHEALENALIEFGYLAR